ncbi:MAG: 6-phosphogluconolactonase [Calditrichia bacterium]
MGKLAALRFVEWLQKNSGWTLSLPTGKTPEHFIKWVTYLLNNWNSAPVRKILEESSIDPAAKPDMRSFHFIQIDEFYPINSWQHNSFYYYVNKYYIDGFGLDPQKAMLINPNTIGLQEDMKLESIWPENKVDLSLRTRYPKNELEEKQKRVLGAIDQWCTDYEARIRKLGGIGFFLGGIGPDGHIGFNVKGSDHYSTTRLTETNYETQAAAATDLGGIEVSRHRLVITIGLQTIVFSPDTTAIIIAAGEAKAKIVREAIESEKNNEIPASILQELDNSAFYLTQGAAKLLTERRHRMFASLEKLNEDHKLQIVTDCSLALNRRAVDLTKKDFNLTKTGKLLTARVPNNLEAYLRQVEDHFKSKIFEGLVSVKNQVFLHTAPHHDDIMLGYLPYLVRLMREPTNTHFFNYLTSGFTAVTNSFMLKQNTNAERFFNLPEFKALLEDDYFDPANLVYRNRDVLQFLDGLAADSREEMNAALYQESG